MVQSVIHILKELYCSDNRFVLLLADKAFLNIYSAEGKLLKQHLMDTNKRETIIDVSTLPPGSYSIAFLRNGKQIDGSRFIIAN